jgi:hypothetical protein
VKTLILRHDSKLSHQYAEVAAKSCDDLGVEWEYHNGYSNMSVDAAWIDLDIIPVELKTKWDNSNRQRAGLCTASHIKMWQKIAESGEDTVVLEHDALMLHRFDLEIPPMRFVALGYKTTTPGKYNHTKAGKTQKIVDIPTFHGTHAYAIKHETAGYLIEEIKRHGKGLGCVDDTYFKSRKTQVKMAIADPISAIGFLRESTIWSKSSKTNTQYIKSYQENLS